MLRAVTDWQRPGPGEPLAPNDHADRTDVDSCHRVWFELHEDLIATLGTERGAGS